VHALVERAAADDFTWIEGRVAKLWRSSVVAHLAPTSTQAICCQHTLRLRLLGKV
jgi:hypothetical protein